MGTSSGVHREVLKDLSTSCAVNFPMASARPRFDGCLNWITIDPQHVFNQRESRHDSPSP